MVTLTRTENAELMAEVLFAEAVVELVSRSSLPLCVALLCANRVLGQRPLPRLRQKQRLQKLHQHFAALCLRREVLSSGLQVQVLMADSRKPTEQVAEDHLRGQWRCARADAGLSDVPPVRFARARVVPKTADAVV